MPVLEPTADGLYCPAGDFHVDPWRPVERAVVTHGHADHARPGSGSYLTSAEGAAVVAARVGGPRARIEGLAYGERRTIGGAVVSLHPAGHCLGSAQVRIEAGGETWVVSGDYRTDGDRTCAPFEPVACDTFVTESTFGLPVFRWRTPSAVFASIDEWWRRNRDAGRTTLVCAYALGKAQRVLAGVDASIGPIYAHGSVRRFVDIYRDAGIDMPDVRGPDDEARDGGGLVVAPPSVLESPWLRRFGDVATSFASGWMQFRGPRRRRNVDRGFVLSDHADWPGLLEAIRATGAARVIVTHGFCDVFARYLNEAGWTAEAWRTRYEGERADEPRPDEPVLDTDTVADTDADTVADTDTDAGEGR